MIWLFFIMMIVLYRFWIILILCDMNMRVRLFVCWSLMRSLRICVCIVMFSVESGLLFMRIWGWCVMVLVRVIC